MSPPKHVFNEYGKYELWWFVTPEILVLRVHIQHEGNDGFPPARLTMGSRARGAGR